MVGIALALWFFAGQAPHVGHAAGINSDDAIPQLMANAASFNPYSLYFWGQNRHGGWPYLLPWLLRQLTGFGWSADALYWWLITCVLSTVWPLGQLVGRWGGLACFAIVGMTAVNTPIRYWALSVGPPFTWQLCSFFWAWWLLRRWVERLGVADGSRRWAAFAPAALLCVLTTWSSPLSVPFLFIALAFEWTRLAPGRRSLRLHASSTLPILVGTVVEIGIRILHQRYAVHRYWRLYWTEVSVDREHFGENLHEAVRQITDSPAWPIVALSLVAVPVALIIRRRAPSQAARFALACTMMAWFNWMNLFVWTWARLNHYSPRYMIPSWVFWTLSAVVALGDLADRAFEDARPSRAVLAGALAIASGAALLAAPRTVQSEDMRARSHLAELLPQRAPGALLLGCYWGTYVFLDATASNPLAPVIHHGDTERTAWTEPRLRLEPQVVVSHEQCPMTGPSERPAPYVYEYGAFLELEQPRWLTEGKYAFSLYRNRSEWLMKDGVTRGGVPLASPELRPPVSTTGAEAFTVPLPRATREIVMYFGWKQRAMTPEDLRAEAVDAAGQARPLQVVVDDLKMSVKLDGPRSVAVRFSYAQADEPDVKIEAIALVP